MRSITIMYDSLNRNYLPPYGARDVIAPNFERLGKKCAVFDRFYAGSLPCMPARRELHTGRLNFLHRSWGPLEPYDVSCFQSLSDNGIYTHFVSDHAHYWQEGGLTYHNRFNTYEFIRGQEGDFWKGDVVGYSTKFDIRRQDRINRHFTSGEKHSHVCTFEAGMEFLEENHCNDDWHLHLEYFDPHEPFYAPDKYKAMYSSDKAGYGNDWPQYAEYCNEDEINDFRNNYKALVSMCDEYLGYVLDFMDEHDMWKDTMLIVNTDHGFMLGEHGYVAKNYMPTYEEISHLPFFIWDPVSQISGRHFPQLAQTIDIAPTILAFHGVDVPDEMTGQSLLDIVRSNKTSHHKAVLFGEFGKHVNVTDGRFVYMRAGRYENIFEYTIMPTHIYTPFSLDELRNTSSELYDGFGFTKGVPLMKIPASSSLAPDNSCYWYDRHMEFGDLLFDLEDDPCQNEPIKDADTEKRMIRLMVEEMVREEAPDEQFARLGLEKEV